MSDGDPEVTKRLRSVTEGSKAQKRIQAAIEEFRNFSAALCYTKIVPSMTSFL